MKIVLTAINAKYIHSNLAVYCLRAFAKPYKDEIEIAEYTINQQVDDILIDLYNLKAKIKQVSIGKITNDSQDWRSLIKMSKEVSSAIIKRSYDKQKNTPKKIEEKYVEFKMGL